MDEPMAHLSEDESDDEKKEKPDKPSSSTQRLLPPPPSNPEPQIPEEVESENDDPTGRQIAQNVVL